MTAHRVVPVSQAWDYTGPTTYRCAHCLLEKRFVDEFDDIDCNVIALPGFEEAS